MEQLYAFGWNGVGQLGTNDTDNKNTTVLVDCATMSTQDGDDAFDIGGLWSSDEEGPTNGPCPTPLGPLDSKTLLDLGLERHDVPGDGNCMVHAFLKNQRSTSHAAQTTSTSVQHTRESLAKFVEAHARAFVTAHSTRGVWPWYRDNWRGDPPPTSVEAYASFLRQDGTWLGV